MSGIVPSESARRWVGRRVAWDSSGITSWSKANVMLSTRLNRWTFAAITLAALAAPAAVLAQTPEHTGDNAAQFPSKVDLKSLTTSGSYLAARHASVERDAASAAAFYRSALRTDPKNNELLDRAFISSLADG